MIRTSLLNLHSAIELLYEEKGDNLMGKSQRREAPAKMRSSEPHRIPPLLSTYGKKYLIPNVVQKLACRLRQSPWNE
jgi:hypothetical protein